MLIHQQQPARPTNPLEVVSDKTITNSAPSPWQWTFIMLIQTFKQTRIGNCVPCLNVKLLELCLDREFAWDLAVVLKIVFIKCRKRKPHWQSLSSGRNAQLPRFFFWMVLMQCCPSNVRWWKMIWYWATCTQTCEGLFTSTYASLLATCCSTT